MIFRAIIGAYSLFVSILKLLCVIFPRSNPVYEYFSLRQNQKLPELKNKQSIVVHCSSYGEYEVVKPILRKIKTSNANQKIALSFFSKSGYNLLNDNDLYDIKLYCPIDTSKDCHLWLKTLRPKALLISQNEIWPNFLSAALAQKVPVVYVGTSLRNSFSKVLLLKPFKSLLKKVEHFFIQSQETGRLFSGLGISNYTLIKRLRDEEIRRIVQNKIRLAKLEQFTKGKPLFILGSTHKSDLEVVAPEIKRLKDQYRFLIAPHDVNLQAIDEIKRKFSDLKIALYTEDVTGEEDMVILDQFGILRHAYAYAKIVYIGGGFDKGVHNVIEAAVHRRPIVIGKKYGKFEEVGELIDLGVVFACRDTKSFDRALNDILSKTDYHFENSYARYEQSSESSSQRVMRYLIESKIV